MTKKTLRVVFTGAESDLHLLAAAFTDMQYLGAVGASRSIILNIDGDGGGQIGVYFPDFIEDASPSEKCMKAVNNGGDIRYVIGD